MVNIKIYDGKHSTYRYRTALKGLGFKFSSKPVAHWEAEVREDSVLGMEHWCFERRLEIETPYSRRSADYRKSFFEANEPNFGRGRYICVYCGIPVRKDNIAVDHLVSVKRAQRSRYYLALLRKWGCESVNDVRNLVPSCRQCNSRKGTKAGIWVVRGLLGRNKSFWFSMWFFYVLALFVGIATLVFVMSAVSG